LLSAGVRRRPGCQRIQSSTSLDQPADLPTGLRFWAGTVKDPFFGNQNGLREFREAAARGLLDLATFKRHAGESPFAGIVSSAIVLEVSNELLPSFMHYYASVDWLDQGHWHRASRVGHVLMPHLYLFAATDEQRTHRHEHLPEQDHEHRALAVATIEAYSRLTGVQRDPVAYAQGMAERLLPDTVPYQVGTPAHYGVDGANGRKLTDDAMDATLSWALGTPVNDDVGQPEGRATASFPFVVPAY